MLFTVEFIFIKNNLKGSETRTNQINQSYHHPSPIAPGLVGIQRQSRQEHSIPEIKEERQNNYKNIKGQTRQRSQHEEVDMSSLYASSKMEQSSVVSVPQIVANNQLKQYQQESLKYQQAQNPHEQNNNSFGQQNFQTFPIKSQQLYQKSVTPDNHATRNIQYYSQNIQSGHKNSNSYSPDCNRQQSPMLQQALSQINTKIYGKTGINSSGSRDSKSSPLNKSFAGTQIQQNSNLIQERGNLQKIGRQQQQLTPERYIRQKQIEPKQSNLSTNNSQKYLQSHATFQGYLKDVEQRYRLNSNKQDNRDLSTGSLNQYKNQNQDRSKQNQSHILQNHYEERQIPSQIENKDAERKESNLRGTNNVTQKLSFHKSGLSFSPNESSGFQQACRETSKNNHSSLSIHQGIAKAPSNLKQSKLNHSLNSGPSNEVYYLSSGGNSQNSSNNLLNQTYANHHNANLSGSSANQSQIIQQFQPVVIIQSPQQQYQHKHNSYLQVPLQPQEYTTNQLQQQIQSIYPKRLSQQSTSSSQMTSSSHLKQNHKHFKGFETSFDQKRRTQIPIAGDTIKQNNISENQGTHSNSPIKNEEIKGYQNYSQLLMTYQKNEAAQKKQNQFKEMKEQWEKLLDNQKLVNSTANQAELSLKDSTGKQQSSQQQERLTENKLNEFLNAVHELKEYDNQLEPIVRVIAQFSQIYLQNIPQIIQNCDKEISQQSVQIQDLQKKVEVSDQDNQKLNKDLLRNEQQIKILNEQMVTQQELFQSQFQQQQQLYQLQIQHLKQSQLIQDTIKNQTQSPSINFIDPSLQEKLLVEFRYLQMLSEEQQKEIDVYKEREAQLLDYIKNRPNEKNEQGNQEQNKKADKKREDLVDSNSCRKEEYIVYKQYINKLLQEQKGNNQIFTQQLANINTKQSDTEESSFGYSRELEMKDGEYPENIENTHSNAQLKQKQKQNIKIDDENYLPQEEEQHIEDQKDNEARQYEYNKQTDQQQKELLKQQKNQSKLKSQSFHYPQEPQQPPQSIIPSQQNGLHIECVSNEKFKVDNQQFIDEHSFHQESLNLNTFQLDKQNFENLQSKLISPGLNPSSNSSSPSTSQISIQPFNSSISIGVALPDSQSPISRPKVKKLELNNLYNNKIAYVQNETTFSNQVGKIKVDDLSKLCFHDEFMSKLNEFSESWREAAERDRKPHTQY